MNLTVGSLFSGVGGFDLGFEQAGCDVRWQIEINGYCAKVLSRHWPDVPRHVDINAVVYGRAKNRRLHGLTLDPVDVLCGGFPCQDLSIAGKRQGLKGLRSGLFFAFMRAVRLVKPRWVVIENVPGLLTSHGGRDFHTVLATLAECGMRRSYRILDSQYFGLAQRRARVFIVGHSRAVGDDPDSILFESLGRERNSAASRTPRPRVAATLRGRSSGTGVNMVSGERARTLTGSMSKHHDDDTDTLSPIANTLAANSGRRHVEETMIAAPLTASAGHHGHSSTRGDGQDNLIVQRGVRRLTPLECERLQGFPDGWTCLCWRGHLGTSFCSCTDSARYKAIGNAVSVPVAKWIGRRILNAEELKGNRQAGE